MQCIK